MEYTELSAIGKIAYTRFKAGAITLNQLNQLVSGGKITIEELNFITGGV